MRFVSPRFEEHALLLTCLQAYMHETDPQFTFFGSHYAKLKAIKQKYDPRGLFVVAKGVGSDDWDESLNCRVKTK